MNKSYLIYPQLSLLDENDRMRQIENLNIQECKNISSFGIEGAIWQPLGNRIDEDYIKEIYNEVNRLAEEAGFPEPLSKKKKIPFDRKLMQYLHKIILVSPAEAGRINMWKFFNIKMFPHIVVWRWDLNTKSGDVLKSRMAHNIRNYFGSLWWHAFLLSDYQNNRNDHNDIIDNLSSDDFFHIFERPTIRKDKRLVLEIARNIVKLRKRTDIKKKTEVVEVVAKRIVIFCSIHSVILLDDNELHELVLDEFKKAEASV